MKRINFIKQTGLSYQLLFVAVIVLTFQSCIKDNFDTNKIAQVNWNPNFAVPLVYSSLSMNDILNLKNAKNYIQTGSDGFLTLVYTNTVLSLNAADISVLQVPKNQTPPSFTVATTPIIGALSSGSATVHQTQTINFYTAPPLAPVLIKIDSILFKSGTMDMSISSNIPAKIDLTIDIPGAKQNGVPFSRTLTINYPGGSPVTPSPSYDLTGYEFDMTQGGTTYNKFDVNYTVKVYGRANLTLTGMEQVTITPALNNLQYSRIVGDLGQQNIVSKTDTITVTIFNHATGNSSFQFTDPKLKMTTYNSFGVPITAQLSQLSAKNRGGISDSLVNTFPFNVPMSFPLLTQEGQSAIADTTLDKSNSNIVNVLNGTPEYLIYAYSAQTNSVSASPTNFILDTSKFRLDLEVELPLEGQISNFTMVDTEKFSIDKSIIDNLSSGIIHISISNGFPLDVKMQIYFTDSAQVILDSLFDTDQLIIASGITNSNGRVTTPRIQPTLVSIDHDRLTKLTTAKKIVIRATVSTENSGATPVKIYSDYKLDVNLGLQVQIKAAFKPN